MNITTLFGIELPVIQAPMAGVQGSELAAAVSEAGALGSLPCARLDHAALREELGRLRERPSGSFNVNFFCHTPPKHDADIDAAWRAALAPYLDELGLEAPSASPGPSRAPFDCEAAEIVSEFRPAVVSFHFGLPGPDLLAHVRSCATKVICSATTVDEARWLEAQGVDAVIAQGLEAGGHRGHFLSDDVTRQTGTLALVPQIVRAVDLPVIAAGGIVDAKGVAAAMTLGAAGVQVGTTYLLCPETTTSAVHRAALKSEAAHHTALTNLFSGRPARAIVNRLMRELGPMSNLPPPFPLALHALARLRDEAERRGNDDFSSMWAGENTTGCRDVPAAEITRALML